MSALPDLNPWVQQWDPGFWRSPVLHHTAKIHLQSYTNIHTLSHTRKVGQNHIYTVRIWQFWQGNHPNIRSYKVYIHGSGHSYTHLLLPRSSTWSLKWAFPAALPGAGNEAPGLPGPGFARRGSVPGGKEGGGISSPTSCLKAIKDGATMI